MNREFKEGDKVRIIDNTNWSVNEIGDIGIVGKLNDSGTCRQVFVQGRERHDNYTQFDEMELISRSDVKVKPEDLTRYMVYGQGCNNKGRLVKTEKELKTELKTVVHEADWTGRIIGYKLVPLYEAEKSVRLKGLVKTTKVKKIKKKKKKGKK